MFLDNNSILYAADQFNPDHVYHYVQMLSGVRKGMTAVNIHHNNKNNGRDGNDAYKGITTWHDANRARWEIGSGVWKMTKSNYGPSNMEATVAFDDVNKIFKLGDAYRIEKNGNNVALQDVVSFVRVCNRTHKKLTANEKSTEKNGNAVLLMMREDQFKGHTKEALRTAIGRALDAGVIEITVIKDEKGNKTEQYFVTEKGADFADEIDE
jgi:hypothetical protein